MSDGSIPPVAPTRSSVLDRDPGRPEPRLVGNGTGLTVGVLASCAVLLAVESVLVWRSMTDAALPRWTSPLKSRVPPRPVKPDSVVERRTVPVPDASRANRPPRGDPAAFFTDVYPAAAIRAGEQGRVVARLRIDETGTPVECQIVTSSGSTSLESATCGIALNRVRFDPARDARGAAKASYYTLPVTWKLPDRASDGGRGRMGSPTRG